MDLTKYPPDQADAVALAVTATIIMHLAATHDTRDQIRLLRTDALPLLPRARRGVGWLDAPTIAWWDFDFCPIFVAAQSDDERLRSRR